MILAYESRSIGN